MPGGEGGSLAADRLYEQRMQEQAQQKQQQAAGMLDSRGSELQQLMQQQQLARQQQIAAQRDTAMAQFEQNRQQLEQQAQTALRGPADAPIIVPSLAPVGKVNNVDTNAALAGTNAATDSFYLNPESTQSQFSVGAPVGAGQIGQRQRPTSNNIVSRSDTLGSKRKDEL